MTTKRTVKKSPKKAVKPQEKAATNGDLEIIFEEPPPAVRGNRRKSKFLPMLEAARQNPGKSVKIPSTNTSVATNIRNGSYEGVEKGEFEVTTRTTNPVDGKARVDVYVKYKGTKGGK